MSDVDFSSAEIEKAQIGWEGAFRHAAESSPFYREHFAKAGIQGGEMVSLAERERIPTIDHEIVARRTEDFLCVPREKIVEIVTTSGSAGRPVFWQLTEKDMERLARNEELSFGCAGLNSSDTVILAVAMDRCFIAGMAYFMGLRRRGCAVLRVGPGTPAMHFEMLRSMRPTAIVGVPSFLLHLAEKAREAQVTLRESGVRKAVCIGEPVRRDDFSLNRSGAQVQEQWGAQVYSTYGVTELASSLCECDVGRGGHLHSDLLFLEALDDDGRPTPEGAVGELTATTFGVEGMPLIRYRTGDFAAIHSAPCSCGRRSLRIGPIVGRRRQKLKVKGTTVFPSALKAILDSIFEIEGYVVIARSDARAGDVVEVRVSCAGDPKRLAATLRERFQGEIKVAPEISHATLEEIEKLQMPSDAHKRRYFVDLRD